MPRELIVMFILQCCMFLCTLLLFVEAVQKRKKQRAWFMAGVLTLMTVSLVIGAVKLFSYL